MDAPLAVLLMKNKCGGFTGSITGGGGSVFGGETTGSAEDVNMGALASEERFVRADGAVM